MSILDRSTFFIKEHVGMMKLVDRYDIHDPDTNEKLASSKSSRVNS